MKRRALPLLALILGLALAGCGSSGPRSSPVVLVNARGVSHAGFLSPTRLAFYRSGGGCPSVPTRLTVQSPDAIRIDMTAAKPPPSGGCTTNLLISPVVIQINPKQINVHHRLKVSLYYPLNKHPTVYHFPPL